jgi:hypothetical protein
MIADQQIHRFGSLGGETAVGSIIDHPEEGVEGDALFRVLLGQFKAAGGELKDDPKTLAFVEEFAGKEVAEEVRNEDPAALVTAAEKAYTEFADKYSADVPAERLTGACMRLSYTEGKAADRFLRALEKDKRRAVQGVACLTLGQVLKIRADGLFEKDAKTAAKLRKESEELLARAAERYGDVKLPPERFGAVVGDKAKNELLDLRHLSTGLTAPEISGDDQDGKPLKLSDYKGKVILLDFWSEG